MSGVLIKDKRELKQMTAPEPTRAHVKRRARERYQRNFTEQDIVDINNQIKAGKGIELQVSPKGKVYGLNYKEAWIFRLSRREEVNDTYAHYCQRI